MWENFEELQPVDLILLNLLSPLILCFLLGVFAGGVKSDLHIPEAFTKGIAVYLMMSIGLQGGVKLSHVGTQQVMLPLLAGAFLSFAIPFLAFAILRNTTSLDKDNAAALSAHYGSIGIITFATAVEFLRAQNIAAEEFLVAVAAIMETPAIISALILSHKSKKIELISWPVFKSIFFHGSVLLLLGGFLIGFLAGPEAMAPVKPFFFDLFKGFLCIFLLDIGCSVASRFKTITDLNWKVFSFAIYMPILSAFIGIWIGHSVLHLSLGGVTVFGTLCASSSYIAVPAAMKFAIPKANPALYMALSLGITFPFNTFVGVPLYFELAQLWANF